MSRLKYWVLFMRECPVCGGRFRDKKYLKAHRIICGAEYTIEEYMEAMKEV